jgi:hypothetical protein
MDYVTKMTGYAPDDWAFISRGGRNFSLCQQIKIGSATLSWQ